MSYLSNLKLSDLKRVSKLLAKRESLLQRLERINAAIDRIDGEPISENPTRNLRVTTKGSRHGKLKDRVLSALKKAGNNGHTVVELSQTLKVKPANLYTWFSTTGKKVAGLKKSKDGRYRI